MITLKYMTEKKPRHKNWKSYCNSPCTTSCNSLFFVQSAKRYCYEDKYDLPQVPKKMIYKLNSESHIIATGIIEHSNPCKHKDEGPLQLVEAPSWEANLTKPVPIRIDYRTHALKETCEVFNVDHKKFIRKLKMINKELGETQNE